MPGLVNSFSPLTPVASNASNISSAGTTTTTGDMVFAAVAWGNTAIGAANAGDVTSVTSSRGNIFTRIGSTFYTNATLAGHFGFAIFYSIITNGGANDVVTANVNNGPWNTLRMLVSGYNSVYAPFFDAVSSGNIGTGTALATNGLAPSSGHTALLMFGLQSGSAGMTMPAPNGAWTQRTSGTSGIFLQEMPYVGQGYSIGTGVGPYAGFLISPFSFSGTTSGSVDWAAVLVSVPVVTYDGAAQGDIAEVSAGGFQQFKEKFFVGDQFLGGYTGLQWPKNAFILPRDYWDKGVSTPYSGQLFPVGPGVGGPGQIYPY